MNGVYEPDAYFGRLEELYLRQEIQFCEGRARYWRRHPIKRLTTNAWFSAQAAGVFLQLMRNIPEASLRQEYRHRVGRFLKVRCAPATLLSFLFSCAMHYHARRVPQTDAASHTACATSGLAMSLCAPLNPPPSLMTPLHSML